jgi:hypothetical protein
MARTPNTIPSLGKINLDDMPIETLGQVAQHLAVLAEYAVIKYDARKLEETEDAGAVLKHVQCDSLYRRLPRNWHW